MTTTAVAGTRADEPAAGQRRWMTVGQSSADDSALAGAEAARAALAGRADAQLLLVFVGITHDLAAVLRGINAESGGVPLVGCSTHGEITGAGPQDGTVVVTALGGPGLSVATAVSEQVSGRQRRAGAEVAESAERTADLPYKVLLMLTDGLIRDQEEILRGSYEVLGAAVPLFGGAAGDGWQMTGTYQLYGDRVLSDAVVAVTIASEAPLAVSIAHGYRKSGEPMVVSSCGEGRVYTLDDEPAMDVYLRRLGAPAEAFTDAGTFSQFALSRPLGVSRRSGEEIRNLSTEVDVDGRSLGGGGLLPQGSLTWVMEGDEDSILAATTAACQSAIDGLDGHPVAGLLTFSCAALRAVLGEDGIVRENARLRAVADGAPFAGFYTYGEIARTRGVDGFHNQTLVVLAFA